MKNPLNLLETLSDVLSIRSYRRAVTSFRRKLEMIDDAEHGPYAMASQPTIIHSIVDDRDKNALQDLVLRCSRDENSEEERNIYIKIRVANLEHE